MTSSWLYAAAIPKAATRTVKNAIPMKVYWVSISNLDPPPSILRV